MDAITSSGILALIGTLVGTFGGILTSNKLTNFRIEQLEKKIEKREDAHSELKLRVAHLEDADKLLSEKIDVANHRIADLEGFVNTERR